MDPITIRAHAKVNLALSLAPPEASGERKGWHRISTWMHAIDLADQLTICPGGSGMRVAVERADDAGAAFEIDWPIEEDLAHRALTLLSERTGRAIDAKLVVLKRIPPQSGLGGGSSNAAAALTLANGAFGLGLTRRELRDLALEVGSDVPFFIDAATPPRPAIVSGFGETLARTRRAEAPLTLILPPFGCPTAEVYGAFDKLGPKALDSLRVERLAWASQSRGELFNDLALAAEAVRPELAALRAQVSEFTGAPVHVTGSGAAMFVVGDVRGRLAGRLDKRVRVVKSKLI